MEAAACAKPATGNTYARREPEKTALFQVLQQHLLTFEQECTDKSDGRALPRAPNGLNAVQNRELASARKIHLAPRSGERSTREARRVRGSAMQESALAPHPNPLPAARGEGNRRVHVRSNFLNSRHCQPVRCSSFVTRRCATLGPTAPPRPHARFARARRSYTTSWAAASWREASHNFSVKPATSALRWPWSCKGRGCCPSCANCEVKWGEPNRSLCRGFPLSAAPRHGLDGYATAMASW